MKKFHIIVIDSGWPTAAHEILQKSIETMRGYLAKDNEVVVLSASESQDFLRDRPEDIGRDPIIVITHIDPEKIVHKRKNQLVKKLNGLRIDLGVFADEDEILKSLIEICRLIKNKEFVSAISWEARREKLDYVLKGVAGSFLSTALKFMA